MKKFLNSSSLERLIRFKNNFTDMFLGGTFKMLTAKVLSFEKQQPIVCTCLKCSFLTYVLTTAGYVLFFKNFPWVTYPKIYLQTLIYQKHSCGDDCKGGNRF